MWMTLLLFPPPFVPLQKEVEIPLQAPTISLPRADLWSHLDAFSRKVFTSTTQHRHSTSPTTKIRQRAEHNNMNMGLKRKFSFEDSTSASLSSSSPSSAETFTQYDIADTQIPPLNGWNIGGAPYLNSRTRKRFRDNRPSQEIVHERTLQKLYSAQKHLHQSVASHASDTTRQQASHISSETPRHPQNHANDQLIPGLPVRVEIAPERNQQSLDAFFSRSRPSSLRTSSSSMSELHSMAALQPPLPSSIYQSNETAPSLIQLHPRTLPSILACEDCYALLLTKQSAEAVDAEMTDVDMLAELVDPEIDEGWQCAVCARRVCDNCAVRGDHRVCLECAVAGSGRYEKRELNHKRWVGGIGWM